MDSWVYQDGRGLGEMCLEEKGRKELTVDSVGLGVAFEWESTCPKSLDGSITSLARRFSSLVSKYLLTRCNVGLGRQIPGNPPSALLSQRRCCCIVKDSSSVPEEEAA